MEEAEEDEILLDPSTSGFSSNDWPMYNRDPQGSRFNNAESQIWSANVGGLHIKWTYPTNGQVSGTPAVVNGVAFVGDAAGYVYAVSEDGDLVWSNHVAFGPITASALVTKNHKVIIGDLAGFIYALDEYTGQLQWLIRPDDHPLSAIYGSGVPIDNDGNLVAYGISSNEEFATLDPNYPCCSLRGSVVLINSNTGAIVWKTFTINDAEYAAGSSGASVWGSATYDKQSNTIFVGTGQNYTEPNTESADALIAFNASNGAIRWINQRTDSDVWNAQLGPPSTEHPDFGFGDSPQVYRLLNGRKVIGAGQKSGWYHVVDATTGAVVNERQVEIATESIVNGVFADSAFATGIAYCNTVKWPNAILGGGQPESGSIVAVTGGAQQELWRFTTPFSPNMSGVAVAADVLYFQSVFDGNLYALNRFTGKVLAAVPTGGFTSGPSVSRGQVYVGSGDSFALVLANAIIPSQLIALGID